MADSWDIEDFNLAFEGNSVTLMDARSLRREIALLRAALQSGGGANAPQRPPYAEEVIAWAARLSRFLPSQTPASPEALRRVLAPLPWRQSLRETPLLRDAYQSIRMAELPGSLFLVPTQWSLRMERVLSGSLHPVGVRYWFQQRWRAPGEPPTH